MKTFEQEHPPTLKRVPDAVELTPACIARTPETGDPV